MFTNYLTEKLTQLYVLLNIRHMWWMSLPTRFSTWAI